MPVRLIAGVDDDGRRLDRILRKALCDLPLSAIHRLLRKGRVLVDGRKARAGRSIREGETITVDTVSETGETKAPEPELRSVPSKTPLCIIFEGEGLLVLNKPAGLAVHGRDSLEEQVLSYLGPKLRPSISFKPGPLHRLDKPSSGLIVFSSSLEGARFFSAMLRERRIRKFYLALVEGRLEKSEIWRDDLVRDRKAQKTFSAGRGGATETETPKTALTKVRPLAGNSNCTLLLAEIETGRTHQIRAQAAAHGHPLFSDKKYGGRSFAGEKAPGGFLLHAWSMELPGVSPRRFEAPPPENFRRKVEELFGEKTAHPGPLQNFGF